jgi:hypothetical protein
MIYGSTARGIVRRTGSDIELRDRSRVLPISERWGSPHPRQR